MLEGSGSEGKGVAPRLDPIRTGWKRPKRWIGSENNAPDPLMPTTVGLKRA